MSGYRSGRPQVAPPTDRRRSPMRGRKNPPLDLTPVPDGTPLYEQQFRNQWGQIQNDPEGFLVMAALPFVPELLPAVAPEALALARIAKVERAAEASAETVKEGTTLFRVFGGKARGLGQSWTTCRSAHGGELPGGCQCRTERSSA
jgi:hypothetical protein